MRLVLLDHFFFSYPLLGASLRGTCSGSDFAIFTVISIGMYCPIPRSVCPTRSLLHYYYQLAGSRRSTTATFDVHTRQGNTCTCPVSPSPSPCPCRSIFKSKRMKDYVKHVTSNTCSPCCFTHCSEALFPFLISLRSAFLLGFRIVRRAVWPLWRVATYSSMLTWASALSILRADVSEYGRSEALGERSPSSIMSARKRSSSASLPLIGDEMNLRGT